MNRRLAYYLTVGVVCVLLALLALYGYSKGL